MTSFQTAAKISLVVIIGVLLANTGHGLAATSWIAESGLSDAILQNPITPNDLKPPECTSLDLQNLVAGSGTFQGTAANDLITGSAVVDGIDSLGGDDCIVGGDGDDLLDGGQDGISETVLDQFNAISYANNDGSQNWANDWQEIGESDGPANGDVNVEDSAGSTTVTIYSNQDTYINQGNPNTNYGSATPLRVRPPAGERRALYRFDLSSIPPGSTVLSATAYFYNTRANNNPVNVHRITNTWTETGATWNNSASAFDPTVITSFTPNPANRYYPANVTSLTQGWVNGTYSNYGLVLIASSGAGESRYASREAAGTARDPYLTVVLQTGASNQALRVQNANRGAWRQVNLGGAVSAQLQYNYLRRGLDGASDYVSIDISVTCASPWTELGRLAGPADETVMQSASFDLSGFLSSTTCIRFLGSSTLGGGDKVYLDDIQVAYLTAAVSGNDVLIGGVGDDQLEGGDGTDICYGGDGTDTFDQCETIFDP